jgi:hypothetical protein
VVGCPVYTGIHVAEEAETETGHQPQQQQQHQPYARDTRVDPARKTVCCTGAHRAVKVWLVGKASPALNGLGTNHAEGVSCVVYIY